MISVHALHAHFSGLCAGGGFSEAARFSSERAAGAFFLEEAAGAGSSGALDSSSLLSTGKAAAARLLPALSSRHGLAGGLSSLLSSRLAPLSWQTWQKRTRHGGGEGEGRGGCLEERKRGCIRAGALAAAGGPSIYLIYILSHLALLRRGGEYTRTAACFVPAVLRPRGQRLLRPVAAPPRAGWGRHPVRCVCPLHRSGGRFAEIVEMVAEMHLGAISRPDGNQPTLDGHAKSQPLYVLSAIVCRQDRRAASLAVAGLAPVLKAFRAKWISLALRRIKPFPSSLGVVWQGWAVGTRVIAAVALRRRRGKAAAATRG